MAVMGRALTVSKSLSSSISSKSQNKGKTYLESSSQSTKETRFGTRRECKESSQPKEVDLTLAKKQSHSLLLSCQSMLIFRNPNLRLPS